MELLIQFVLAAGLAWASGIRLYLVLFVVGLLARFDHVTLPETLAVIENDWVLWASGIMLVGEFVADKVPAFDSMWDGLHTFIRIPIGTLLAWGALGDYGPAAQMAAGLIGGTLVTGAHLTKAGTRAVINHSPEPVSNWTASAAEDGLVALSLWLMLAHPWVFAVLLGIAVLVMIWVIPKVWRALGWVVRRITGRAEAAPA
jgi:hypothetical protein